MKYKLKKIALLAISYISLNATMMVMANFDPNGGIWVVPVFIATFTIALVCGVFGFVVRWK